MDFTDFHGLGFKICEIRANPWQKEPITVESGATVCHCEAFFAEAISA